MQLKVVRNTNETQILAEDQVIVRLPGDALWEDTLTPIGENAFRWTRKTGKPVTAMRMQLFAGYVPTYFQIPSVNYNGNGWGSGAQYGGYDLKGEPWVYAWHRIAIPACTYTENDKYAVALFGDEEGGMSCSVHPEGDQTVQELIWPETETPKVLYKRCWEEPYYGTMEPTDTFTGIIFITKAQKPRSGMNELLDFAWTYFARDVKMGYSPERVEELDHLYFRQLWYQKFEGPVGFSSGFHWVEADGEFRRTTGGFECGWVGQNISVACCLLNMYLKNGDEDLKNKALSVLDSWDRYAFLPNGLMLCRLVAPMDRLDSVVNGDIPVDLDACNLGTAATYYFRAAKLCKKAGIDRPNYLKRALGLCDFAVSAQRENGEMAKTWFMDGTVNSPHGSVGCFFVLPLFDAWEVTGEEKYRTAALRGMDFYLGEFMRTGSTTAGALDSNCIDKESAGPVLRGAVRAWDLTHDEKYKEAAIELGYYLATWQWHYSTRFPKDSLAYKAHFDTYGCTAVSAAHNALDFYGLYWVPEYLRLAEMTGNDIWRQRARALWYNGIQLLSDGTLVINNRVRPAGSQDESVRHTRWARPDHRCFVTSEWLTNWQGTYREVALDMLDDWDVLR